MYSIPQELIEKSPEIRIGDKIYKIDNKLSTFLRILKRLDSEKAENNELNIIIGEALGKKALEEIVSADLPYTIMHEIIIIILAAIQGLEIEEARSRFKKTQ